MTELDLYKRKLYTTATQLYDSLERERLLQQDIDEARRWAKKLYRENQRLHKRNFKLVVEIEQLKSINHLMLRHAPEYLLGGEQ